MSNGGLYCRKVLSADGKAHRDVCVVCSDLLTIVSDTKVYVCETHRRCIHIVPVEVNRVDINK